MSESSKMANIEVSGFFSEGKASVVRQSDLSTPLYFATVKGEATLILTKEEAKDLMKALKKALAEK